MASRKHPKPSESDNQVSQVASSQIGLETLCNLTVNRVWNNILGNYVVLDTSGTDLIGTRDGRSAGTRVLQGCRLLNSYAWKILPRSTMVQGLYHTCKLAVVNYTIDR